MDLGPQAFHLKLSYGQVGRYVLLTGDPGRCEQIASLFDEPVFAASNREFTVYNGKLSGVPVSVCSTGIGGPSAVIALEELVQCGAHTFLRIGTCGGIAPKVQAGDLVLATAAVRQEGTGLEYAPAIYPAAADFTVLSAQVAAAKALGLPHHVGVIQSKDSFYGQHDPARMPVRSRLETYWEAWKKLGVLASEMEAAALFVAGAALGVRVGAAMLALHNQETDTQRQPRPVEPLLRFGVETLRTLIKEESL